MINEESTEEQATGFKDEGRYGEDRIEDYIYEKKQGAGKRKDPRRWTEDRKVAVAEGSVD